MNEDKELEEAIRIIKSVIYDKKGSPMNYIDISFSQGKDDIGAEEFIQAIETVLQELDKLQQKEKSRIIGNIYGIKIEDLEPILKPYYIPKKKIEDIKSKYKEKYEKHKAVADKIFEEIGTRNCFDNELAIKYLEVIRVCEELLED